VNASISTFGLDFINTGKAGAVFQVRSGNAADNVRAYTVEHGKQLSGTWKFTSTYDLSVYGPNGFARYFKGSVGHFAGILDVRTRYDKDDHGSVGLRITNVGATKATVVVQDAYTGEHNLRLLLPGQSFESDQRCDRFFGWYDLVLKITEDPTFLWRFAGHVETGRDSYSDPALGGLVTLKA
jgi:phospholipase C